LVEAGVLAPRGALGYFISPQAGVKVTPAYFYGLPVWAENAHYDLRYYDDFGGLDDNGVAPGAGAFVRGVLPWFCLGQNVSANQGANGIATVASDGVNAGSLQLRGNGARALVIDPSSTQNPIIRVRWAQLGAVVGTM